MAPALFVSPLLQALLGDAELTPLFSAEAEIRALLAFERALAESEAAEGAIPAGAAKAIVAACDSLAPDIAGLTRGAAKDGVVVPELIRQLRRAVGAPDEKYVHHGATSQDVIDTALALRLKIIGPIIRTRIARLMSALDALAARDGARTLMGHTRMQRARSITAAHKIGTWRAPLERHRTRLDELSPRLLVLQFGGAVGNRAELGEKAQAIADRMADALGLHRAASSWHTQRDGIVEFGQWLALLCGHLGKVGADVALMAQNEVSEIKLAAGGGSSAMPEKSNPVQAEILVTLARYSATLAGGLHHALVHENERSGAAWTLEWLLLPPAIIAAGAALTHVQALIEGARFPET